MTKLTVPIDFESFKSTVETLERTQRAEYIFENLSTVHGGDHDTLWKYAVEAKVFWEKRCCTILEYITPQKLYDAALSGQLPKMEWREKELVVRLARSLLYESAYCDVSVLDRESVDACYKAEALIKHINNKRELLGLYIHFPEALRIQNPPTEVLTAINHKALALALELGEKQCEMEVLTNFGRISELERNYNAALQYYRQTLEILDGIIKENNIEDSSRTIAKEYLPYKANLLFYIAKCELYLGNIRDAVTIGNQAIAYSARMKSDTIIVNIHQLLGRAYSTLGAHHNAVEHLVQASNMAEVLESPFLIGQTKTFIAIVYNRMREFQKAIEYGLEAISILQPFQSIREYLVDSERVGSMMVSLGEFDRAQMLFIDLLATIENTDKSINLDWQKDAILRQLARIAIKQERWDDAVSYLQDQMNTLDDERNLRPLVLETLMVATEAHIGAKSFETATNLAERSLKISEAAHDLQNQYTAHRQLSVIAEQTGDLVTAYHHHKEFHRIKEKVFNDESDTRNHNMIILLEQQEAVRSAQAERIKRFELEEEIGQLSTALVHREQALKEIRATLRTMKYTNEHAEQVVEVLKTVIRTSENAVTVNSTKTYKMIDEKIESTFPILTKIQRELCRFISLGHSTKDVAKMMNISVQSVNTQRYRIRTRLALTDTESLDFVVKQAVKLP